MKGHPSARARAGALAACFALALACRGTAPVSLPPPRPQAPRDGLPPKVALVLGGGAARGFAHVGVLEVLEEAGIPVELIVGTSVGSLVGAIYADGKDARQLARIAVALDRGDFFDFSARRAVFGVGLAKGDKLARFVEQNVSHMRIEELPIPFAAVATDLDTGERVVLAEGSVIEAVRASCAIPGVFEPVRARGRLLVDGGLVANLPVEVARELGADVVIAVDVSAVAGRAEPDNFMDVLFRAINILMKEDTTEAARLADVVIVPAVGELELLEFDEKERARRAGAAAALAALPAIREALGRARGRPGGAAPRSPNGPRSRPGASGARRATAPPDVSARSAPPAAAPPGSSARAAGRRRS